jgi:hypothetical protein
MIYAFMLLSAFEPIDWFSQDLFEYYATGCHYNLILTRLIQLVMIWHTRGFVCFDQHNFMRPRNDGW